MNPFHEIYGSYYKAVAEILGAAVAGGLTEAEMRRIVAKHAFSESALTIIPALRNQKWPLLDGDFGTPLKAAPDMPLTTLELRWLKAITLDPRVRLFRMQIDLPEDVEPLFRPEDVVVFDQYGDGDNYADPAYIRVFHTLMDAIRAGSHVRITYPRRTEGVRGIVCFPRRIEYSEKDDKFRLQADGPLFAETFNIGRIISCEPAAAPENPPERSFCAPEKKHVLLELVDRRNALERVMLHFAHFEKEAERVDETTYRLRIFYDPDDETEMLIRVLSFGSVVRALGPDAFVERIRSRLMQQKERRWDDAPPAT